MAVNGLYIIGIYEVDSFELVDVLESHNRPLTAWGRESLRTKIKIKMNRLPALRHYVVALTWYNLITGEKNPNIDEVESCI